MNRTEAEELFLNNTKLVRHILSKKYPTYQFDEDLYQIGCIGLWRACLGYDSDLGIKFSTYACPAIENEIRYEFRKRNSSSNRAHLESCSIDETVKNSDGCEKDGITYNLEAPSSCILADDIVKALSERRIKVLKYVIEGYSYREIGKKLGVTNTTVMRDVKVLRKYLSNNILEV